jgi:general secretion pathway protein M
VRELPQGSAGRALALAIGALVVVIFCFLIVSPILGFYGEEAQFVRERAELALRYKALARDLPDLRVADKRWRDQFGGELLLTGQSDATASAEILGMMKTSVEDSGARLTSAEILPAKAEGEFRRIGIRVAFSGDLKLVTSVLRGLETAHPVLFAGDFNLNADSDSNSPGAGSAGNNGLAMILDVYGFREG